LLDDDFFRVKPAVEHFADEDLQLIIRQRGEDEMMHQAVLDQVDVLGSLYLYDFLELLKGLAGFGKHA